MRTWITTVAILLITGLTITTAEAKAKGTKTKKDKALSGTIVSVAGDGGSMVLSTTGKKKTSGGGQKTLTLNASTTISINGSIGNHGSDLQSGMKVKVKVSGDVAQDIVAGKKDKKKKK